MLGAQCSVFSVNSTMAPHIHRLTMPTSRCSFAYLIYLTSTSTSTSSTNSRQKSCFICIYACIICLRKSLFANEFCSFGRNDVCINNPLTVECCAVIILLDPLWKKKKVETVVVVVHAFVSANGEPDGAHADENVPFCA